jgi:sec-independent protein translocase protein TatC
MSDASNKEESFISHLIELRNRLIRAVVAVVLVFIVLFPWANDLYTLLAQPLIGKLPQGSQMIATGVASTFFIPLKVTMMTAFLITLPFVLYQMWAFIAPGLYLHERKLALPLLVASVLLFFIGMAFAYFLVFPVVFGFLAGATPEGVNFAPDIGAYLDFVMTLFIAFGVTFEVPVVVILLVLTNMVSVQKLREVRPYVIVGAFIIGAIFTPPDVISQIMLAIPLWILYELGIILAGLLRKVKPAQAPAQDAQAVAPQASQHAPYPTYPSDYEPLTYEQMEAELNRIEAENKTADPEAENKPKDSNA